VTRILWSQKQDVGPSARTGHAMAYDPVRERVVLFGGSLLGSACLADTWEWDGEFWVQVADTGPSARTGHQLAVDSDRSIVVLFGGRSGEGTLHDDTWQWDGKNWLQVADTGPDTRTAHGMVFDGVRSRIVLFGGEGAGSGLRGDTWEWDGDGWTQVEDTGPSARRHHSMAVDERRGRTVLFGGDTGAAAAADTWEWDGTHWVQVADTGPGACGAAAMTFDGVGVLLFGGIESLDPAALDPKVFRLTWQWDGEHWALRQDMGPSPRWGHALTFDAKRGCLVLFGGLSVARGGSAASDLLGDTWEASMPVGAAAEEVVSLGLAPETVMPSGEVTISVEVARSAGGDGVPVEVTAGGAPDAVVTITIPAGAKSGDSTWRVPSLTAPGDIELQAGVGESSKTATLHVAPLTVAVASFTITPETVGASGGDSVIFDVRLDQPAPAGGLGVSVYDSTGTGILKLGEGGAFLMPVEAGDSSMQAQAVLPAAEPGEYRLVAQLGDSFLAGYLNVAEGLP
jgi:hypothetical protein